MSVAICKKIKNINRNVVDVFCSLFRYYGNMWCPKLVYKKLSHSFSADIVRARIVTYAADILAPVVTALCATGPPGQ